MKRLKSAKDIERFCASLPYTPVGLGVFAFDRFGLQTVFPAYEIIALRESADVPSLRRQCPILTLESGADGISMQELKKMNHAVIARTPRAITHLRELPSPVIVPPQSKADMEKISKKHGWLYAAPSSKTSERLENKKQFRKLLAKLGVAAPASIITTTKSASFFKASNTLGLPFIIQAAASRGGRGTFLIRTQDDMVAAMAAFKKQQATDVVLSAFINGYSVSTTAVATRWGIFSSDIQTQVVETEIQASFGDFLGHDWSFSRLFPRSLHTQAIEATRVIGAEIYRQGFRGFFGVDFLIDKADGRLYAIECNPRFTGALPTADLIQASLDRPLFCALHVLEFLADRTDIELDGPALQKTIMKPRQGSHLVVSSPFENATVVTCALKPGTYELNGSRLKRVSQNLELKNLANDRQVIITQMLAPQSYTPAHGIVCRILSRTGILERSGHVSASMRRIRDIVQSKTTYDPVTT